MPNKNHPFFTVETLGFSLLGIGIVGCLLLKWWAPNPLVLLALLALGFMYFLLFMVSFVRIFIDNRPISFTMKCLPTLYGLALIPVFMGLSWLVDNDFGRDIPPAYRMRDACIGSSLQLRANGTFKQETSAFIFNTVSRGTYRYVHDTLTLTDYDGDSSIYIRAYYPDEGYVLQEITDTQPGARLYHEDLRINWKLIRADR